MKTCHYYIHLSALVPLVHDVLRYNPFVDLSFDSFIHQDYD